MWIVMHKWSLRRQEGDIKEFLDEEIENDVIVRVAGTEKARLTAMRKFLGGMEDASAPGPDETIVVFRRLDPSAPGGIGYAVSAQLFNERPTVAS